MLLSELSRLVQLGSADLGPPRFLGTVIVFDWDDTLLPTTVWTPRFRRSKGKCEVLQISEHAHDS